MSGEGMVASGKERGTLWRSTTACVVQPSSALVLLLLVHGPNMALSAWPVCYDYYVPDKVGPTKSPG